MDGVADFARRCLEKWPEQYREIFPGARLQDFFDAHDIHLESPSFLVAVVRFIGAQNIGLVKEFAAYWSALNKDRLEEVCNLVYNKDRPLDVVDNIFTTQDIEDHGRPFLWHVLNEMRRALQTVYMKQHEERVKTAMKAEKRTELRSPDGSEITLSGHAQLLGAQLAAHLENVPVENVSIGNVPRPITLPKREKPTPAATVQAELRGGEDRRTTLGEITSFENDTQSVHNTETIMTSQRVRHNAQISGAASVNFRGRASRQTSTQTSTPYSTTPNLQYRKISGGYVENMAPRIPANNHRARQPSQAIPSPRYPCPVDLARMHDQQKMMTSGSPSQNYANLVGYPPHAVPSQFMPNQCIANQPFEAPIQYTAMVSNSSMMAGGFVEPRLTYPNVIRPISEITNVQYPNTANPRSAQPITADNAWASNQGHAMGKLYDPYGPSNPGFAQGPPRGKGKSRASFSNQAGRGRKFSTGSYGRGHGQYNGDRGNQNSYRGSRHSDAPMLPGTLQQGHRASNASRKETEPFPQFDPSRQAVDIPTPGFHQPPTQNSITRRCSDRTPQYNVHQNIGTDLSNPFTGCGQDWIGPKCDRIRDLWVFPLFPGFSVEALRELFEGYIGGPIKEIRANHKIGADGRPAAYGFVCFHSPEDARKGLLANGIEFNGQPLKVQVPRSQFEIVSPDRPFGARTYQGGSNSGRPSLQFGSRRESAGTHPSYYGQMPAYSPQNMGEGPQNVGSSNSFRRSSGQQAGYFGYHNMSAGPVIGTSNAASYSPQDARSDLPRQHTQETFATRGSPELRKGKPRSVRSSPKKNKQRRVENKSSPTTIETKALTPTPSVSGVKSNDDSSSIMSVRTSQNLPATIEDALADTEAANKLEEDTPPLSDGGSKGEGSNGEGSNGEESVDEGSIDEGSMDEGPMDEGPMDEGSMDEGLMDDESNAPEAQQGTAPVRKVPEILAEEKQPVPQSDADKTTSEATLTTTQPDQQPEAEPIVVKPTASDLRNSDECKPTETVAQPQTPVKAAARIQPSIVCKTPDAAIPDLGGTSDDDQKVDASFHSAKESQSPRSDAGADFKDHNREKPGRQENEQLAVPVTESSHDIATLEEEMVTGSETMKDTDAISESTATQTNQLTEPLPEIIKTSVPEPPKPGAPQTESLHPFAKSKKKQQQPKQKASKKKGKGKEAEVAKFKDADASKQNETEAMESKVGESSKSRDVESSKLEPAEPPKPKDHGPSKPKEIEPVMPTENEPLEENIKETKARSKLQSTHQPQSSNGKGSQKSKTDFDGVAKEDPRSTLRSKMGGNDSIPSNEGDPEPNPTDAKDSFFSQWAGTKVETGVLFADKQDPQEKSFAEQEGGSQPPQPTPDATKPPQTEDAPAKIKEEIEKQKRRKEIFAKVAVPKLSLRSNRIPSSAGRSDGADVRSPITPAFYTPFLPSDTLTVVEQDLLEDAEVKEDPSENKFESTKATQGTHTPTNDCSSEKTIISDTPPRVEIPAPQASQPLPDALPTDTPTSQPPSTDSPQAQTETQPKKKSKRKKKKAPSSQGGVTAEGGLSTESTAQKQAGSTPSGPSIEADLEFGEQKSQIDGMKEGTTKGPSSDAKGKGKVLDDAGKAKNKKDLEEELVRHAKYVEGSPAWKLSTEKIRKMRLAVDEDFKKSEPGEQTWFKHVHDILGVGVTEPAATSTMKDSCMGGHEQQQRPITAQELQELRDQSNWKAPSLSLIEQYYDVKKNEYIPNVIGKEEGEGEEEEDKKKRIRPPMWDEI